MTQIIMIYYNQFWNFYKKTTKMLNSDLVSFALMKLSNSGPMLKHMFGGDLTKPGKKTWSNQVYLK